jgi:hypothetical protein
MSARARDDNLGRMVMKHLIRLLLGALCLFLATGVVMIVRYRPVWLAVLSVMAVAYSIGWGVLEIARRKWS